MNDLLICSAVSSKDLINFFLLSDVYISKPIIFPFSYGSINCLQVLGFIYYIFVIFYVNVDVGCCICCRVIGFTALAFLFWDLNLLVLSNRFFDN